MRTRLMIIDEHPVVLEGIRAALSSVDGIEIVGTSSNGQDALRKVSKVKPHIIIMDPSEHLEDGLDAASKIKTFDDKIKVIVFTMHTDEEAIVEFCRAGVSAYVLKQNPIDDLYLAIQAVQQGGTYFSQEAYTYLIDHLGKTGSGKDPRDRYALLSLRERQVFQLLAEGMSVKDTADVLKLSPKTVETHKYHIMEKMQIRSMSDWTKEAIRRGIIKI